jgi:hypothetical protein
MVEAAVTFEVGWALAGVAGGGVAVWARVEAGVV